MQLDLPFGPWTKMVSAQWGDFPLTIYQNPDKMMLLVLFEREGETLKGCLVFLKRGLMIAGDPSRFGLSQKGETVIVSRLSRDRSDRYILLSSSPAFVDYNLDALVKAVNDQYAELDTLTKATVEILRGYDCKATEFKAVPEEKLQSFLGDPFSLFSLSMSSSPTASQPSKQTRCLLGLDKAGEDCEVKFASLRTVFVSGGLRKQRLHAMHIIAEEALLNNIPVIVFDSKGSFAGLANPNADKSSYEAFHLKSIPLGFPFKDYALEKGLFIDLSHLSPEIFLQCFGLDKSDVAPVIKKVYAERQGAFFALSDLLTELSAMKDTPQAAKYTINKAARAVEVIQKSYPNVFAKSASSEMYGSTELGKVIHVSLGGQPPELAGLAMFSVLSPLLSNASVNIRMLAVFEQDAGELSDEAMVLLSNLSLNGIGVVLHAEHSLDMARAGKPSLRFDMMELEAIASEEGEKQKRMRIRPAYSQDSELGA